MPFIRYFYPGYIVTYNNQQLGGYCQKVNAQLAQDIQEFDIPYRNGKLQYATNFQERPVTLNFIIANPTRTESIAEYNRTASICVEAIQKTIYDAQPSKLLINDSNRFIYATFKNINKDEDANSTEGIFNYTVEFTTEDSVFFENGQRINFITGIVGSVTKYFDPYNTDNFYDFAQPDISLNNGETTTYDLSIQVRNRSINTTYCKISRYDRSNILRNEIVFNDLRNLAVDELQQCVVRTYDVFSNTQSNKTFSEFTFIGRYFFLLSPHSADNRLVIQTDGVVDVQFVWNRAYTMYE